MTAVGRDALPSRGAETATGPDPAPDAPMAGTVAAARVVSRLARHLETALAAVDLTMPQYRVLALLSSGTEGASVLAEKLSVSRPSLTAVVDGLVARGLVERRPHGGDRRRILHVLTPQGRELLNLADAAGSARLHEIAAHLDAPRNRRAWAGLEAWAKGLDAYRDAMRAGRP